jgi:lipopolysaccharide exporter
LASPFIKNVSKLLSVNIAVAAASALLAPLLTRTYTPEEFGAFALFMTFTGIAVTVATGRYELAIILPRKDNSARGLMKLSLATAITVSGLSALLFYIFRLRLADYFDMESMPQWILYCGPTVFLMALFQIFTAYFNRHKYYTTMSAAQAATGISNPVIKILLGTTRLVQHGLMTGFAIANLLGTIIYGLVFFTQKKRDKVSNEKISLKELAYKYRQFPLYNMPHALSNFLSGNLPFIMLVPAFGDFKIGLYSIAFTVVFKPVSMLGNAIYQVFSQKTVENHHSNMPVRTETIELLKKMIFIGIVPFAVLFLFAPALFAWYFGNDYYEAGKYMQYLLPWLFMVYITAPLSFIPNLFKQQSQAFLLDLIYLAIRFMALMAGIYLHSFEWSIILFSATGALFLMYYLYWCIDILKKSDDSYYETY